MNEFRALIFFILLKSVFNSDITSNHLLDFTSNDIFNTLHNEDGQIEQNSTVSAKLAELNSYLRNLSDPNQDVCENYYGHICGSVTTQTNPWKYLYNKNVKALLEVLRTPYSPNENKAFQIAKAYFTNCLSFEPISYSNLFDVLRNYLKDVLTPDNDILALNNFELVKKFLNNDFPKEMIESHTSKLWGILNHNYLDALISPFKINLEISDNKTISSIQPHILEIGMPQSICGNMFLKPQIYYSVRVGLSAAGKSENVSNAEIMEVFRNVVNIYNDVWKVSCSHGESTIFSVSEAEQLFPYFNFTEYISTSFSDLLTVNQTENLKNLKIRISKVFFDKLPNVLNVMSGPLILANFFLYYSPSSENEGPNVRKMFWNDMVKSRYNKIDAEEQFSSTNVLNQMSLSEFICFKELEYFATPAMSHIFTNITLPVAERKRMNQKLETLTTYVVSGFKSMLEQVNWLSVTAKSKAIFKVNSMKINTIGPAEALSSSTIDEYYNGVNVTSQHSLYQIRHNIEINEKKKFVNRLFLPHKDRNSWIIGNFMPNAFYFPLLNTIFIPLAVLQKPFFDIDYPSAYNFGSTGNILGHELSHAFDHNCVVYNENGDLEEWVDKEPFSEMAECLQNEYSNFCTSNNICVDGKATLGDNIADVSGFHAALRGFEHYSDTHVEFIQFDHPPFNQYTPKQIFITGFSQIWCDANPEQFPASHSPAKFRIMGTLRNNPAFRNAFYCKTGQKYAPAKYCNVWISPLSVDY